eukprot:11210080-Lingulodinium_polyedra.AAC.1
MGQGSRLFHQHRGLVPKGGVQCPSELELHQELGCAFPPAPHCGSTGQFVVLSLHHTEGSAIAALRGQDRFVL